MIVDETPRCKRFAISLDRSTISPFFFFKTFFNFFGLEKFGFCRSSNISKFTSDSIKLRLKNMQLFRTPLTHQIKLIRFQFPNMKSTIQMIGQAPTVSILMSHCQPYKNAHILATQNTWRGRSFYVFF